MKKNSKTSNKKKEFNQSLTSFIIWGSAMLIMNIFWFRGAMWSLWAIFFWGLAILKKAIDLYGFPFRTSEIEEEEETTKYLGDGSETESFEPPIQQKNKQPKWNEDEFL